MMEAGKKMLKLCTKVYTEIFFSFSQLSMLHSCLHTEHLVFLENGLHGFCLADE